MIRRWRAAYLYAQYNLPLVWPLTHLYCPCGCGQFRWRYW